ncbi:MAG TPA: PLP-dependent transferase [Silvibacterium sp.]|nr:PLP-dependent transferase [Silvibacterium sp.]
MGPEARAKLGITDGLVRISVGIEDVDDLLEDLGQALDHI